MSGPRKLTTGERLFVAVVKKLMVATEGYQLGFLEELVREHGLKGFFEWSKKTQALTQAMERYFGERDAHFIASLASFWNGCDYCAYGHLLAYNIMHHAETGELFGLDEKEVPRLMRMRDGEALAAVLETLADPKHARLRHLLQRQYALKLEGARPQDQDDRMLIQANGLYDWINECSIVAEAPAPPLGRIAKRRGWWKKYAEVRAGERREREARAARGEQAA